MVKPIQSLFQPESKERQLEYTIKLIQCTLLNNKYTSISLQIYNFISKMSSNKINKTFRYELIKNTKL